MPPGGGAAGIGVKPCNSRVVDINLRGHLIARFTCLEQSKHVSLGTSVEAKEIQSNGGIGVE